MPSGSFSRWNTTRKASLDGVEQAHQRLGPSRPGIVALRQHVVQGYTMQLSSQFQGFCRDLHSECTDAFANNVNPPIVRQVVRAYFLQGRKLETGNPNPGNLGNDFNRFGLVLWARMTAHDAGTTARKAFLEGLNLWRNAFGHQDFTDPDLGGRTSVTLVEVRAWRKACHELAVTMDAVMLNHFQVELAVAPW
jgi:hypothetical protein